MCWDITSWSQRFEKIGLESEDKQRREETQGPSKERWGGTREEADKATREVGGKPGWNVLEVKGGKTGPEEN